MRGGLRLSRPGSSRHPGAGGVYAVGTCGRARAVVREGQQRHPRPPGPPRSHRSCRRRADRPSAQRDPDTPGAVGQPAAPNPDSGAVLAYSGSTLISQDTYWGTGDDDNDGNDVSIRESNGDLIAGYDFNGVASFTCSWDDQICE